MSELIAAVDIQKSFRTEAGELQVLKDINLSINEGEMVSITGASGAGKSTLMHILGGLDRPTAGKILFRGTDVFSMEESALALFRNRSIGFVFQFHHLLPEFNALENTMLPGLIGKKPYADVQKKAQDLLGDLGLSRRLHHRPGELSGGEQQRVAVARALMQDSGLVLADEPTGNLDTSTGESLFELFLDLNKKKNITFIIVTHNMNLSDRCHRILRMADGMLV
ncbi:MAG: ABC transporter ATP-binding protein [Nitrospirae bacterium]|nr:ABC transporter ATP-binding protein [Nitrospirota bacterium]